MNSTDVSEFVKTLFSLKKMVQGVQKRNNRVRSICMIFLEAMKQATTEKKIHTKFEAVCECKFLFEYNSLDRMRGNTN